MRVQSTRGGTDSIVGCRKDRAVRGGDDLSLSAKYLAERLGSGADEEGEGGAIAREISCRRGRACRGGQETRGFP
jgi:hypothetical protein